MPKVQHSTTLHVHSAQSLTGACLSFNHELQYRYLVLLQYLCCETLTSELHTKLADVIMPLMVISITYTDTPCHFLQRLHLTMFLPCKAHPTHALLSADHAAATDFGF